MIGNSCYFFEKTKLTWENAKIGCRNKFAVGGKLFEPKSLEESKTVWEIAKSIITGRPVFWIGVKYSYKVTDKIFGGRGYLHAGNSISLCYLQSPGENRDWK